MSDAHNRLLTSLEDVSLAIMALNVLGDEVCPITNRPPYAPSSGSASVIVSAGSGCVSTRAVPAAPGLPPQPARADPRTTASTACKRVFDGTIFLPFVECELKRLRSIGSRFQKGQQPSPRFTVEAACSGGKLGHERVRPACERRMRAEHGPRVRGGRRERSPHRRLLGLRDRDVV